MQNFDEIEKEINRSITIVENLEIIKEHRIETIKNINITIDLYNFLLSNKTTEDLMHVSSKLGNRMIYQKN